MSHKGSLLILPSGMRAWDIASPLRNEDFTGFIDERSEIDVVIIGMGAGFSRLPQTVAAYLESNQIMFDCMTTSSAIHTYNLMLAENRRVAAAMIAV
jgi:uncharacterized protein